jgi:hypothetical protein
MPPFFVSGSKKQRIEECLTPDDKGRLPRRAGAWASNPPQATTFGGARFYA